jgi:hypothetical protein
MQIETSKLRGFAEGSLIRLRPVQEDDLSELARIRAQLPGGRRPLPWTAQRLRKSFENSEKPGLWSEHNKTYCCTDKSGRVVGFIVEEFEAWIQSFTLSFYVDDYREDRDELGREMLQAYMTYLTGWFDPGMVVAELPDNDTQRCAWLEAAGFERDLHMLRTDLCQGEVVGRFAYAWRSAARRAGEDLSSGEPAYPGAGSSRGSAQEAN